MMTLEEALELLHGQPERPVVEHYVARAWVRPVQRGQGLYFEEIDIARIRLVHHLQQELLVNDEAMEVVLHLLDQLYGLREHLRNVMHSIERQPEPVRAEIIALLTRDIR